MVDMDKAYDEFSVLTDEAISLGIVTAKYWWKSIKYVHLWSIHST